MNYEGGSYNYGMKLEQDRRHGALLHVTLPLGQVTRGMQIFTATMASYITD